VFCRTRGVYMSKLPGSNSSVSAQIKKKQLPARQALRLAVLRWLFADSSSAPSAVSSDVKVRLLGVQADLLASWHPAVYQASVKRKLQVPKRIMLVICAADRASCWPACAERDEILEQSSALRLQMQRLEKDIRSKEPHLLDNNMLFEEYAEWDYGKSVNHGYQELRTQLNKLEKALYKGTQLEKIAGLNMADELYLAVPEGVLLPEELRRPWGLLTVSKDLQLSLRREALPQQMQPEMRRHMIQNMLVAQREQLLENMGLKLHKDGSSSYVSRPRSRKLKFMPEL